MSASTWRLEGYPAFAAFIAKDKNAAIYSNFEKPSARNLLYLQSELRNLERQLEQLDGKDAEDIGDLDAQKAARLWTQYDKDPNEQARRGRNLQRIIRKKIREYRVFLSQRRAVFVSDNRGKDEAMVLESQILSLNSPSSPTLRAFKRSFEPFLTPALWGRDEHLFENESDLVALAPADTDGLNLFGSSRYARILFHLKNCISQKSEFKTAGGRKIPCHIIVHTKAQAFQRRTSLRAAAPKR